MATFAPTATPSREMLDSIDEQLRQIESTAELEDDLEQDVIDAPNAYYFAIKL